MSLSPKELSILQHALGLDQYGCGTFYRNHFCAGGKDEDVCRALVALGYMKHHPTTDLYPYYNCSVTEAGKEAIRRESPPPPKKTPGQRRYQQFLEAESGLRFGEWLKTKTRRSR